MPEFKRFDSKYVENMLTDERIPPELAGRIVGSMRDGYKKISSEEVLTIANELRKSGLVCSRCPEYTEKYPERVYLSEDKWASVKEMILDSKDVGFLGVGSFLGNEEGYLKSELEGKYKKEFVGYVKGVEINPWHLLVGTLARGQRPEDNEFYIGDACDISQFEFGQDPGYVYSHGLLHAMNARNSNGKKDKRIHMANIRRHLNGVYQILDTNGMMVGVTFSKRDYNPPDPERGPTPISKDELYDACKASGFPKELIYIKENQLTDPKKGISYQLFFVAQKLAEKLSVYPMSMSF